MRQLALASCLALGGCFHPTRPAMPDLGTVEIAPNGFVHLGEQLTIKASATDATVSASFVHLETGERKEAPLQGGSVLLDAATLPDFDPATGYQRYDLTGSFPKYALPGEYASDGKPAVYAPAGIAVVLTRTDPADLVSLTALRAF